MTDKEYEEQKERINVLSNKWINQIGLGHWNITIVYYREPFKIEPEDFLPIMRTRAKWQYMLASIDVSLSSIMDMSDDDLERSFVHELAHIFLNETRQGGKDWLDHEERVATALSKAFIWIRYPEEDEKDGNV